MFFCSRQLNLRQCKVQPKQVSKSFDNEPFNVNCFGACDTPIFTRTCRLGCLLPAASLPSHSASVAAVAAVVGARCCSCCSKGCWPSPAGWRSLRSPESRGCRCQRRRRRILVKKKGNIVITFMHNLLRDGRSPIYRSRSSLSCHCARLAQVVEGPSIDLLLLQAVAVALGGGGKKLETHAAMPLPSSLPLFSSAFRLTGKAPFTACQKGPDQR